MSADGAEPPVTAAEAERLRDRVRGLETLLADAALAAARASRESDAASLRRVMRASEYRDDNTWEHTERVGETAFRVAVALGLDETLCEDVRLGAPLHDIGKIAIPDEILLKPDRLTSEEFEVVKTHAPVGAAILDEGEAATPLLRCAERIARCHHERFDGNGYPDGLAGEAIPIEGRVVAVADVFDVLVHERPYKSRWTPEDALAELRRNAGTQFDPAVVEAFAGLGAQSVRLLAHGEG